MKNFIRYSILIGLFILNLECRASINADFASNYSGGWTNGANGGAGFSAWSIDTTAGSGTAIYGIWPSASAELEMGSAFGFGAWGGGADIRLNRSFIQTLTNGNVFAFDLGLNADAGSGGAKGFILRTADNRAIVTVTQTNSDTISINGSPALTNNGSTTMHWTITQISSTQVKVYATGRSGSEATTITVTNATTSYLASIQFYATNLVNDADAALRGVYFDNLILSQAGGTNTFTYTVDSSQTTITGISTNASGDVVIPSTLGGYPVVAIDRSAFKDRTNITSITFQSGETVTNIGVTAFQGCTKLALAVLPTALTVIPDGLFSGCTSLVSVTIPASVTNIGNMAFANCPSLPSVALPAGLKVMGESVFLNCRNLAAIDLPTRPENISGQSYYECRTLSSVDFPADLTNVGYAAFYNCLGLTTLTPPSTLTTLAADAFNGCSGLTTLSFNGALTSIGDRAFYGCTNLTEVYFLSGASSMGSSVFGNDASLANLYFGGSQPSVTNIADLFAASSVPVVYALNGSGWSSTFGSASVATWLPALGQPVLQSGTFSFAVGWANGQSVRVQTCTNLSEATWSNWSTNTISNGYTTFSDPNYSTASQRFYRLTWSN